VVAELAVLEDGLAQIGVREAAAQQPAALEPRAPQDGGGERRPLDDALGQLQIRQVLIRPVDVGQRPPRDPLARGGRGAQENRSQAD
jgi:hypothetical protein